MIRLSGATQVLDTVRCGLSIASMATMLRLVIPRLLWRLDSSCAFAVDSLGDTSHLHHECFRHSARSMLSVARLQPAITSTTQHIMRNTSCCWLKPCTVLPGAAFKPSNAAHSRNTNSGCRKGFRSQVLTRLQATADQQPLQEVFEYITLFKVLECQR